MNKKLLQSVREYKKQSIIAVFYCGSMYDRYGTGYEIYKPWFVYAGSRY